MAVSDVATMVSKNEDCMYHKNNIGNSVRGSLCDVYCYSSHLQLRVFFMGDNLVIIFQMIVILCSVFFFLFAIPWKDLVALKTENYQETTSLENRRRGYSTI